MDKAEDIRKHVQAKFIRKVKDKNVLQIFWEEKATMATFLKFRTINFQDTTIQLTHPPPIQNPKYSYVIIKPVPKNIHINGFAADLFSKKSKTCVTYINRIYRTTAVLVVYFSNCPLLIWNKTRDNIIKSLEIQYAQKGLKPTSHSFDFKLFNAGIEKRKKSKQQKPAITDAN
jgi:hypothetical protein